MRSCKKMSPRHCEKRTEWVTRQSPITAHPEIATFRFASFAMTKAFTLVELIVVITILVILGTIAFVSLGGYAASARDSARIENLSNLHKGLSLFQVKSGTYPMPENAVNITASGTIIGYQWFAKEVVGAISGISKGGTIDPADANMYTTYSVNASQNKMALMAFLEEGSNLAFDNPYPTSFAASDTDYSKRTPTVKWDALGILLGSTGSSLRRPIQETGSGVDIIKTSTGYTAYFTNKQSISGTGTHLSVLHIAFSNISYRPYDFTSCQSSDGDVLIGGQCWKSLNHSWGTIVPAATPQAPNTVSCWSDVSSNCAIGGWLYQVSTVLGGQTFSESVPSGVQGPCLSGYHVPSSAEYKILFSYLGYYAENFTNPVPDVTTCYGRNLLVWIGPGIRASGWFGLLGNTWQWYSTSGGTFQTQNQTMLLTSSDPKNGWNAFTMLVNNPTYAACGIGFYRVQKESLDKYNLRCIKN